MLEDSVGDEELLYRSVPHGKDYVKLDAGKLRPSSQAFADRDWEVSVDRAKLCGNNPAHTQFNPTDYVCSLTAGKAREIGQSGKVFQRNAKGEVVLVHAVIVKPDPLREDLTKNQKENPAHALIIADPQVAKENILRRRLEALAFYAAWEERFAPTEPN